MEIVNIDQQSPEWFEIRKLKMTASNAQAIGNCGKGLETYIQELCQEYYSSAEKEHFSNKHTERGNELEESAAFLYECETGNQTDKVGFIIHSEFVGCSPDRLVGTDGLIEIKCPDDKAYFDLLINDEIDSKYIWQMQMQMLISRRLWCDFVAYNPHYTKSLIIKRVLPEQKKQEALIKGFAIGEQKIRAIQAILKEKGM
ncbi:MAG TPA: YqaJ viral recombinase family protein [Spirochaetota bacterium]|nr:YqaJ viral recombinase family protein [Spirochaetota bacterium]